MSTLTRTTFDSAALAPVAVLHSWDKPLSVPLADGGKMVVQIRDDTDSDLTEYGRLEWTRDDKRPKDFDGGAVKVRTRSGNLWFQPSPDYTPEGRIVAIERVRDYYLEHWGYVGVVVTRHSAPMVGPFGNDLADTLSESVWGIESDAGEYFVEVVNDLAHELGCDPA